MIFSIKFCYHSSVSPSYISIVLINYEIDEYFDKSIKNMII